VASLAVISYRQWGFLDIVWASVLILDLPPLAVVDLLLIVSRYLSD
jgi:uncharacterized protein YceK